MRGVFAKNHTKWEWLRPNHYNNSSIIRKEKKKWNKNKNHSTHHGATKLTSLAPLITPMDPSKRKRPAADESTSRGDRRRPRRSSDGERGKESGGPDQRTAAASDAEVEEFYTILQRMKATRCAAAASDNGVRKAERLRWRPAFVWEDFEGGDGAVREDGVGGEKEEGGQNKRHETVRARGWELDLNADPEPDDGDRTARCTGVET